MAEPVSTVPSLVCWHRALRLGERAALLTGGADADSLAAVPAAQRRLARWRSQRPFGHTPFFEQRLELDHIDEGQLCHLLAMSAGLPPDTPVGTPDWLADLARGYALAEPGAQPELTQQRGFLALVEPLLLRGRAQLQAQAQRLAQHAGGMLNCDTITDILAGPLHQTLSQMINRALALELHVARLQGTLQGDTPEERFRSFIEQIRQPEKALKLFEEYPVLARQAAATIDRWVLRSTELLERLCRDRAALCATFGAGDPGELMAVSLGGDLHDDGRGVTMLTFRSGWRLIYRPRPVSVYRHTGALLSWLNERHAASPRRGPLGDAALFRPLVLLDCGTYGWIEHIGQQGCPSATAVERFYYRQGAYLALLYGLAAIDFHHENLIAAGEHPVLIDLETLFHPALHHLPPDGPESVNNVLDHLYRSVLSIGMLPQHIWGNDDSVGVDMSGLGGTPGQRSSRPMPAWDQINTDAMQVVYKHLQLESGQNRPTLDGAPVVVTAYTDTVVRGFSDLYWLLQEHREALLAHDGPIQQFVGDTVRVIARPTLIYRTLQQDSWHPDMLRDAMDCERLFDKLWEDVAYQPALARLIQAERRELWRGDIPMFTTQPQSCDLWGDQGEHITGFIPESGLEYVLRRLGQLDEADHDRQVWYIRAAMTALPAAGAHTQALPRTVPARGPASSSRLLAAACRLGDRIEALAVRGGEGAAWLGLIEVRGVTTSVVACGPDLYGGTSGIALFLAWLGALSGAERYTDLARAALSTLRQQLAQQRVEGFALIGAFEGWGGAIYALAQLGLLWGERQLLDEAAALVEVLEPRVAGDGAFDIIAGAAGAVPALLGLHRCTGSSAALAAARRCGEHLLAHAQPLAHGVGWANHIPSTQPLTGFGHGTAGIAWALGALASATGDQHFATTARAALAYERALFMPSTANWPDFRALSPDHQAGQQHGAHFWCHGAPGIGLGRLLLARQLPEPSADIEIAQAINDIKARGLGASHCLCHGDLGNLGIVFQAARKSGDSALQQQTYRLLAAVLDQAEAGGWRCGVPQGIETPGLMTGLAGIGYQLLRFAEPQRVPDILSLETLAP